MFQCTSPDDLFVMNSKFSAFHPTRFVMVTANYTRSKQNVWRGKTRGK